MNEITKKETYGVNLDFDTTFEMGRMITQRINMIIPEHLFPKIELRQQGVKRGTSFYSAHILGDLISRDINRYLRDIHLDKSLF